MNSSDKSTRSLKRWYIRRLKTMWRYQGERRDGATRHIGASGWYWSARKDASEAKEELKRRGVEVL